MSQALEEHKERGARYKFLVRRLQAIDVGKLYEQLSRDLTLKSVNNGETVAVALEAVERRRRSAASLHQVAVDEFAEFDLDWNKKWYEWEVSARTAIKSTEGHKGVVSGESVLRWVAAKVAEYPPWDRARRDLLRAERMTRTLVDCWESRAATLRKLLDKAMMRPNVPLDPNLISAKRHGT